MAGAAAGRAAGRFPSLNAGDAIALSLLLLIVPLVVGLPFAHVGEITRERPGLSRLFHGRLRLAPGRRVELAKGDVLPVNPYFAGDALHYYWMPHVLVGGAVSICRRVGDARRAAADSLDLDRCDLRRVPLRHDARCSASGRGRRRRAWPSSCSRSSFEGLYALCDFARKDAPLSAVKNLNIDAISRWYFQGIPIDGLQRVLFYQPHHASAT